MTVNRGPGVAKNGAVGVTTVEHRLQLAGQYAESAPGVPRSGVMAQGTTVLVAARGDMSYDIGPCQAVISRTDSEGVYTPTLTGTTNVPTDDAPASNSRWDLIYIKQNDMAKGDADNLAVVGVVKGTAAAAPAKPTGDLPAGALLMAEARIFAGTTATNGGSNTVSQSWRHTAARGAPIPVRNIAERGEITPSNGVSVRRLDLPGRPVEHGDGSGWVQPATVVGFTADGETSTGLGGSGVPCNLVAVALLGGRRYRAVYRFAARSPEASLGVIASIRTSPTSDTTEAGTAIPFDQILYTSPRVNSWGGHRAEVTWTQATNATVNVKAILARVAGAQAFDIADRTLYVEDLGAA